MRTLRINTIAFSLLMAVAATMFGNSFARGNEGFTIIGTVDKLAIQPSDHRRLLDCGWLRNYVMAFKLADGTVAISRIGCFAKAPSVAVSHHTGDEPDFVVRQLDCIVYDPLSNKVGPDVKRLLVSCDAGKLSIDRKQVVYFAGCSPHTLESWVRGQRPRYDVCQSAVDISIPTGPCSGPPQLNKSDEDWGFHLLSQSGSVVGSIPLSRATACGLCEFGPTLYSALVPLTSTKVLYVGTGAPGVPSGHTPSMARVLDFSRGTVTPLPHCMLQARTGAGAARLADGTILICGGCVALTGTTTSAEVLDLVSGRTRSVGCMNVVRENPFLVPLNNGNALVVGGHGGGHRIWEEVTEIELFRKN